MDLENPCYCCCQAVKYLVLFFCSLSLIRSDLSLQRVLAKALSKLQLGKKNDKIMDCIAINVLAIFPAVLQQ